MADIDPFKILRNTETLQAYRRYQGEVSAKGQPWLTIAMVSALTEGGLFTYALIRNHLHELILISCLMVFVSGLSFAIAQVRMDAFKRSHPLNCPDLTRGAQQMTSAPNHDGRGEWRRPSGEDARADHYGGLSLASV